MTQNLRCGSLYRRALDELGAVLDLVDDRAVDAKCSVISGAGRIGVYGCGREAPVFGLFEVMVTKPRRLTGGTPDTLRTRHTNME